MTQTNQHPENPGKTSKNGCPLIVRRGQGKGDLSDSHLAGLSGLRKRFEYSWKTRNAGFEDRSPEEFYNSVLTCDSPICWIDKIVFRAPLNTLPLTPETIRSGFIPLRKKHYFQSGIRSDLQYPCSDIAIIKTGHAPGGPYLYIELIYIDPYKTILAQVLNIIEHLIRINVLAYQGSYPRRKARRILSAFCLSEIETRFDFGEPLCNIVKEIGVNNVVSLNTKPKHFSVNLTSWQARYTRGSHIKIYERAEDFMRFEINLFTKLLKNFNDNPALLNCRAERFIPALWPLHLEVLKRIARVKPILARQIMGLIRKPIIFPHRTRDLNLSRWIVREMATQGQVKNIF